MNPVTHPLSSADISIFSPEISKICYIKKYRYRLYYTTCCANVCNQEVCGTLFLHKSDESENSLGLQFKA